METLTMTDRGDCCAAQARVLVTKGNHALMFCGHHFSRHSIKLLTSDWKIALDDREGLLAKAGAEVS